MPRDEVVQPLIVFDEAMPKFVMRVAIVRLRRQTLMLCLENLVFSEKSSVFLRLSHVVHEPHRSIAVARLLRFLDRHDLPSNLLDFVVVPFKIEDRVP